MIKMLLPILLFCLAACDPIQINVPPIEIPAPEIPCNLAPGDCALADEEFAAKWDSMADAEQIAYVEEWGKPGEGFQYPAHPKTARKVRTR